MALDTFLRFAAWSALILVLIGLALALPGLLRRYLGGEGRAGEVEAVLAAEGAARCLAAVACCQALARRGDPASIALAWSRLELPLLQALPDCPPDLKPALASALEALHGATGQRSVQKSIMDLRRGLLA